LAAHKAESTQLETIRAAAEKWAGAIATIIGLFAISGIVKGPDDFAKVAVPWQFGVPIAWASAVTLGAVATVLAARAAYGLPQEAWLVGSVWVRERAIATKTAATWLYAAIGCALASFISFALAVGILWFAPRSTPLASLTLVTTSSTLVCGQLKSITMSEMTIADQMSGHDVTTSSSDVRIILSVTSCPAVSRP